MDSIIGDLLRVVAGRFFAVLGAGADVRLLDEELLFALAYQDHQGQGLEATLGRFTLP
jgi:hypothetical protein